MQMINKSWDWCLPEDCSITGGHGCRKCVHLPEDALVLFLHLFQIITFLLIHLHPQFLTGRYRYRAEAEKASLSYSLLYKWYQQMDWLLIVTSSKYIIYTWHWLMGHWCYIKSINFLRLHSVITSILIPVDKHGPYLGGTDNRSRFRFSISLHTG